MKGFCIAHLRRRRGFYARHGHAYRPVHAAGPGGCACRLSRLDCACPGAALPGRFSWFRQPASWQAIAIVTGILAAACILSYIARHDRTSPTVPVVIVVGLTATSFVLAFSSYWICNDKNHPTFFTTLAWTASLIKGGVDDRSLGQRRVSFATAGRARGRPPDDPGRVLRQRRRSCRCDIPHTV